MATVSAADSACLAVLLLPMPLSPDELDVRLKKQLVGHCLLIRHFLSPVPMAFNPPGGGGGGVWYVAGNLYRDGPCAGGGGGAGGGA
uniref:Uncharacterized protein n=1 Tax=Ditylenchus dipsaci TaxID=166011 RepID=A0A915DCH3_9BILA